MKLSDIEKRMLNGKNGLFKQKALEYIVRYGEVLGADELCKVTKAHLFCGAHPYLKAAQSPDMETVISEMCFCSEEKLHVDQFECFCQSDVAPLDTVNWQKMGASKEEFIRNEDFLQYYLAAGVHLTGTCVPYLTGFLPLMGEHYVSSESHAVIMLNSLLGACGNADGLEADFCAAACGRIPLWGNHIMQNRKGTHVFQIECTTDSIEDWDLLGYTIGRLAPTHSIPVIANGFERPDVVKLKSCFASMATTGGAEMCHIVGVTPEATTLEHALGKAKPQELISITKRDIEESRSMLSSGLSSSLDYVSLGCPHYAIDQMRDAAEFLSGKKVSDHTILHIWTAASIKAVADRCGYTQTIEKSGAIVLCGACPLTSEKLPANVKSIAFDSAKQAHYIKPMSAANVYHGSAKTCLQSAISGKWEGMTLE